MILMVAFLPTGGKLWLPAFFARALGVQDVKPCSSILHGR
jgi:hypothetical protein